MKKLVHLKKIRRDNSGFSLVELLVAVIILGLIVGPLLHTFVTGANTSARSRRMGDATLASQNLAETVEANSIAALVAKTDDNTLYGGKVESSDLSNVGVYDLRITGINAGNSKFNATLSFNPNTAEFASINAEKMADYTNMDAVFAKAQTDDTDPDHVALRKLNVELAKHTQTALTGTKRTITVDVTKADDKLFAELKFDYVFTYTEQVVVGGKPVTQTGTYPDTESYTLFPQGFSTANDAVPGIYVMYNPMYDAVGGDKIIVNNNQDLKFKMFLIKQKTAQADKENSYVASVVLHNGSHSAQAQVFSNARENLNDGGNITSVIYDINIGTYEKAPDPVFDGAKQGDLVSKSAKNRIYDVTIKLYGEDDADCTGTPISTFNTTKLQ